jgi:hypothetical protein
MAVLDSDHLDLVPEDEEDEVYIKYDIATYPSDFTLTGIVDLWKAGDIVIPDFQREYVWTIRQASLLIESFLMGLPVPSVFFYIDEQNKSLVIDGQQRILSIVFFIEGYFGPETTQGRRQVFRLQGLSDTSPYHNLRFEDLTQSDQRKLRNSVLRAINVKQLSPTSDNTSIYHIFERLNTGGTALSPQEIRNCVYRGDIVAELRYLNSISAWRKILGKPASDRHQRDVEIILRLFALFEDWQSYEKPMKEYLNTFMSQNRRFASAKARRFKEGFLRACETVLAQLGSKPFNPRGQLNTSTLDAVFIALLEHTRPAPSDLKARYAKLIADNEFTNKTRRATTDTATVHERITMAKRVLIA